MGDVGEFQPWTAFGEVGEFQAFTLPAGTFTVGAVALGDVGEFQLWVAPFCFGDVGEFQPCVVRVFCELDSTAASCFLSHAAAKSSTTTNPNPIPLVFIPRR